MKVIKYRWWPLFLFSSVIKLNCHPDFEGFMKHFMYFSVTWPIDNLKLFYSESVSKIIKLSLSGDDGLVIKVKYLNWITILKLEILLLKTFGKLKKKK